MAEAAVETPNARFFCHQCSGEIRPVLPGFTCPQCESGFIEEISPEFEEERRETSNPGRPSGDSAQVADALFDLWGRHFLTSLGALNSPIDSQRELSSDSVSSSSGNSEEDEALIRAAEVAGTRPGGTRSVGTRTGGAGAESSGSPGSGAARTGSAARRLSARTRVNRDRARMAQARWVMEGGRRRAGTGDPNPFLQDFWTSIISSMGLSETATGMVASILQNLTQTGGGPGGTGTFVGGIPISVGGPGGATTNLFGFPMNMLQIHGNPGDYAWGSGGLDAIISQLLNQLDGSGAPPAAKETIESLPKVSITKDQVDIKLQCSVCMEDYKLDEMVHKLPCDHLYHENCIVPWLELHGTCPVCRKGLSLENENNDDDSSDDDDFGDGGVGGDGEDGGGGGGASRGAPNNVNVIFSPRPGESSGGNIEEEVDDAATIDRTEGGDTATDLVVSALTSRRDAFVKGGVMDRRKRALLDHFSSL